MDDAFGSKPQRIELDVASKIKTISQNPERPEQVETNVEMEWFTSTLMDFHH